MSTIDIYAVPAFDDNYLWVLSTAEPDPRSGKRFAYVVDPGDATVILETLEYNKMQLKGILTTHHHFDHVGGIAELVDQYNVSVYGPEIDHIPHQTRTLQDGERLKLAGIKCECEVMFVPGHTKGHIAYYFKTGLEHPALFCGDTLFAGGCGRLLGGTADQLFESLEKIKQLDPETRIYCAHEYTVSNLRFAVAVEPGNPMLQHRLLNTQAARDRGEPTVPSRLQDELNTNPFLRCDQPEVIAAATARMPDYGDDPASVFMILRKWKDVFVPAPTTD
ncbi:MAG: hydroxyacylglutathione hydrolase [Gammaproteobacteria bacterium]